MATNNAMCRKYKLARLTRYHFRDFKILSLTKPRIFKYAKTPNKIIIRGIKTRDKSAGL
jgi:hypothetical protein